MNYYRLKMVDADGRFTYSKIVSVAAPVNNEIVIFPNPVKDKLFIRLPAVAAETEVIIADAGGTILDHLKLFAGTTNASVNTASLPPGVYSISFQSGKFKSTRQFIRGIERGRRMAGIPAINTSRNKFCMNTGPVDLNSCDTLWILYHQPGFSISAIPAFLKIFYCLP